MSVVRERVIVVQTATIDWWALRSPRERLLLMVAAGLAAAVAILFGFWRPLQAAREQAQSEIARYTSVSAAMRAAGPEAIRRATEASGPASSLLGDAAAGAGLTLRRVEPDGERTRVTLEDVQFTALLAWLDRLERSPLRVVDVRIDRRPTPGMVNAQVTVAEN